jgi:hypothetical protein
LKTTLDLSNGGRAFQHPGARHSKAPHSVPACHELVAGCHACCALSSIANVQGLPVTHSRDCQPTRVTGQLRSRVALLSNRRTDTHVKVLSSETSWQGPGPPAGSTGSTSPFLSLSLALLWSRSTRAARCNCRRHAMAQARPVGHRVRGDCKPPPQPAGRLSTTAWRRSR